MDDTAECIEPIFVFSLNCEARHVSSNYLYCSVCERDRYSQYIRSVVFVSIGFYSQDKGRISSEAKKIGHHHALFPLHIAPRGSGADPVPSRGDPSPLPRSSAVSWMDGVELALSSHR